MRGETAAVGALAATSAAWAMAASRTVLPYGSINHDEAVYRLQADALVHGHLFPVAPRVHPEAFVPWLSASRNGRFVPKYAPVHAAVLAVGRVLTGTDRAGLGLIAAGVVVMTYLLAKEVLGSSRQAVLAAGLLAASPIFMVQSATYLSYCTGLVLLEALAWCAFKAARTGRVGWHVGAGMAGALAFFARSYDAVLFGLPLLAFLVLHGRVGWRVRWLAAGAAGPLALLLAFNRAATGSALKAPFGLLDASDSIGFGNHRIYPTDPYIHFTPREGLIGMLRSLGLTGFWCFGGLVLIGLAAYALGGRPWRSPGWWLAGAGLMIPAGYFFFWGNYGATIFGAPRYLGPYYYLPALAPIAVLGAAGLAQLWRWDRGVAQLTAAGMAALSLFVVVRTIHTDLRLSADDRRLNHGLATLPPGPALVFLPPMAGPELLIPWGTAMNHYGYTGRVVYALDEGPEIDREIAGAFPDRRPYVLVVTGAYRADPPDRSLTSSVEALGDG